MEREQVQQIAVLVLEDGAVFYGRPFGAVEAMENGRRGEVVFATGMTGYQEICTDPSYRGQMVVLTYPLVGNYGVASEDVESRRPWLSALIVREACDEYQQLARQRIARRLSVSQRHSRRLRTGYPRAHTTPAQHGTLRGISAHSLRTSHLISTHWLPRHAPFAASAS